MKNIVLIGMPGTGKSVVGRALAARLGYGFVDLDDLIVERAGKTLPEILRQDGLEAFYALEEAVGTSLWPPAAAWCCILRPWSICGKTAWPSGWRRL